MHRYRTEIEVPEDRFVSLQLPPDLPVGRAIVTVSVEAPGTAGDGPVPTPRDDDFEWWEEFESDSGEIESTGLGARLSALEP